MRVSRFWWLKNGYISTRACVALSVAIYSGNELGGTCLDGVSQRGIKLRTTKHTELRVVLLTRSPEVYSCSQCHTHDLRGVIRSEVIVNPVWQTWVLIFRTVAAFE
jgi:hypothetical protein